MTSHGLQVTRGRDDLEGRDNSAKKNKNCTQRSIDSAHSVESVRTIYVLCKTPSFSFIPYVFLFFQIWLQFWKIPLLKVQVVRESVILFKNYWTTDLILGGNRELAFIIKLIHPRSSLYVSPISVRGYKYTDRLYFKQKQIKSNIFE